MKSLLRRIVTMVSAAGMATAICAQTAQPSVAQKQTQAKRAAEAEESNDPVRADQAYESCVRALLEKRRGKTHRLIFNENCNYGFVRNLLGLKTTGILIALASTSVELILWWKHGFSPTDTVLLPGVIAILVLGLLITFATHQAARRTAMAYADALLRSCEPATSRSRMSKEKN